MPINRNEFEHNIWLLSAVKINVTRESVKVMQGLREAKFAPNKRVNLHTVSESARLMANSIFSLMINQEENNAK
ncbi:hypothetical protein [Sphingobacterium zeae]|uniref:Uncharacterized protein n=1 Tax=Sphingobacterium zeae TaxID=1776859 RepID=A0ABU0U6E2_9SPHI|nr:hypothetical protein [Sphingobacterium zeae]MDQ1150513.1 hypothetical protein [Sphingobacterium zeae]